MFQNILFPTDFSPASQTALPFAVAVARQYASKVNLLHVIPAWPFEVSEESLPGVVDKITASAEQRLNELARSAPLSTVSHETVLRRGDVGEHILKVVQERAIDLIVLGTRGRGRLQKFWMGSVAEEIFRLAPCPVLTVGPHCASSAAGHDFRTVLYATDFSADSLHALPYVLSVARQFRGCLVAMHAVATVVPEEEASTKPRLTEFFIGRLRALMPPNANSGCRVEFDVEFGSPAPSILKAAEKHKADLIAIGIRGAGTLARAATHLGSTAYQLVSDAQCPVLTCRGTTETKA